MPVESGLTLFIIFKLSLTEVNDGRKSETVTPVLNLYTYLLQKMCYLMNLPDFYTKSHKTTELNHCIGVIVQYIQQDN